MVCVVTNQISDDANGCNIEQEEIWLEICRVGDVFCVLYSLDGETFNMVRLFHLPVEKSVKVGLEAQSPAGEGGLRLFSDVSLEYKTVKNLRAGMVLRLSTQPSIELTPSDSAVPTTVTNTVTL